MADKQGRDEQGRDEHEGKLSGVRERTNERAAHANEVTAGCGRGMKVTLDHKGEHWPHDHEGSPKHK